MQSNRQQPRAFSFLASVFCAAFLCSYYLNAYGDTDDPSIARVQIVVERPQTTLHDYLELARLGRQDDSGRLLGQFFLGPIFALPDALGLYLADVRQSAASNDALEDLLTAYPFGDAILAGLENLSEDSQWELIGVEEFANVARESRAIATAALSHRDATHSMIVSPVFLFAPDMNSVRLSIKAELRVRSSKRSWKTARTFDRRYDFVTTPVPGGTRAFHPGERAILIDQVNTYFDNKLERYPRNKKAYRKERKVLIKALEKDSTIPASLAIRETWTNASLGAALQHATDGALAMLAEDLRNLPTINSAPEDNELQKITVLSLRGDPVEGRGIVVTEDDRRYVSRDAKGHCYSLPKILMQEPSAHESTAN